MKVGINGMGRIGKTVLKILSDRNIEVPQINDPFLTPEYLAYTLQYDSTYGPSKKDIKIENNTITFGATKTTLFSFTDPSQIPWDVDIVIEATGVFTTQEEQCKKHKCKKVLITAPLFVYGVNHKDYKDELVFSNTSCTTNCLAPIVKIIDDAFEITVGLITTIHAATATLKVVNCTSKNYWRSGRGVMQNIIPASTGAAKAVTKVIPKLECKITSMAMRVPVSNVSVVDFTFKSKKSFKIEGIMQKIREAVDEEFRDIVGITDEHVVSSDFNGCSLSSIVDINASIALNDNLFNIISWYDNEYGYSCSVMDYIEYVLKKK